LLWKPRISTYLSYAYLCLVWKISVGTGYREVVEIVKAGKVDVGAGRYAAVKDDPALRIIYVSIFLCGLSPLLSNTDRQLILDALINAPPEIKAKANYGDGQYPMMNSEKSQNRTNFKLF